MDISVYVEQQRQTINRGIESIFLDHTSSPYEHHKAAIYTMYPEGHRFRSIIMLELLRKVFDQNGEDSIEATVGLECIHHAALIYDDLSCMDNAEKRKGKPTTWKKYGQTIAILAAIHLVNKGNLLIYESVQDSAAIKKVMQQVYNAVDKSLCGQEDDSRQEKSDEELLASMGDKNRLFYLAWTLPAVIIQRSEYDSYLHNIGNDFAVAYQLFDDLRDIGDSEITGKPVGIDEQKRTSVYRWGEEEVRRMLEERRERVIQNVRTIQPLDYCLERIINYIFTTPS
jgi:geranylgeranyl diphosphate synthase, type II